MKVLYAIQGTGNGHISRAQALIPELQKYCELDLLISGTESELTIPYPVKYTYRGFSFLYNRKGGINYTSSGIHNFSFRLLKEIWQCPVKQYDLVINDFEPVSAWAAKLAGTRLVALGHQASFTSPKTPRPQKKDLLGEAVLQHYAPAKHAIGLHFDSYDNFIFPPIIRPEVRKLKPVDRGFYLVYLPAVHDERLIGYLNKLDDVNFIVFSRYASYSYQHSNVGVRPIDSRAFAQALATCSGLLTGAGFETPAEALYLGKKLFVIPIKGQYEQHCNAAALSRLGVPSLSRITKTLHVHLREWIDSAKPYCIEYPDVTKQLIRAALG
jgi:uncharacterized protein (TIGR00661 family)